MVLSTMGNKEENQKQEEDDINRQDDNMQDDNMEDDNKEDDVQLRREFSLFQGVAVIVGLVIGSGIYISPTGVLRQVPSAGIALILWVVAGLISTLGALTFAEIGTTIPIAGEKYAYLKMMYGDFVAFEQMWQFFFMTRPSFNVLKSMVFGTYIIKPFFPHCDTPYVVVIILAIVIYALLTYVNCINVRLSALVQTICSSMTVAILLVVIFISWVHIGKGNSTHLSPSKAFENLDDISGQNIILGLYTAMFPYGGWFVLNFLVEELKDPYKNLPRAIIISMSIICSIYILVNVAYLAALGVNGVIASEAVVISFGVVTVGKWTTWVFAIVIALNNLGSLNGGILTGSRMGFAGGRSGHLPRFMALISTSNRTPIPAVLVQLLVAIFLCALVDIYSLINQLISLALLFDFLTTVGIVRMRIKHPHMKRSIKMPLIIPISYALSTFSMLIIALVSAPKQTGIGLLIVVATSVPYYLVFVKRFLRSATLSKYSDDFLVLTQKILNATPQEGEIVDN